MNWVQHFKIPKTNYTQKVTVHTYATLPRIFVIYLGATKKLGQLNMCLK
jgi:hypothetical protein